MLLSYFDVLCLAHKSNLTNRVDSCIKFEVKISRINYCKDNQQHHRSLKHNYVLKIS